MRNALLVLVLLLFGCAALAQEEIPIAWTEVGGASGYFVYSCQCADPRNDPAATKDDVLSTGTAGDALAFTVTGLPAAVDTSICVTAYNASGESAGCVPIVGWPTPRISRVDIVDTGIPGQFRVDVVGENLHPDQQAITSDYPGMTFTSITWQSSSLVQIDYSLDSTATAGFVDLALFNNQGAACNYSPTPGPGGEAPYSGCVVVTALQAWEIVLEPIPADVVVEWGLVP